MIIDVMNGKAGERKVGTDGVKDRSLRGGQKKKSAMKKFTLPPIDGIGKTQQFINSCQGC